jgi:hypothetical protein
MQKQHAGCNSASDCGAATSSAGSAALATTVACYEGQIIVVLTCDAAAVV